MVNKLRQKPIIHPAKANPSFGKSQHHDCQKPPILPPFPLPGLPAKNGGGKEPFLMPPPVTYLDGLPGHCAKALDYSL